MTITCLPINASSGSPAYAAQAFRQAQSAYIYNGTGRIFGGQSGVLRGREPVLSASSTTWSVGAFVAVIEPQFNSAQSLYEVVNDAAVTGSVTAADATNGRYDILYCKVNDTDIDSSGSRNAQVLYLAGTPSGSPALPATPARSYLLGWIFVPHSGAGSPTTTNNPIWSAASGGVLPVQSGPTLRDALITAPLESMLIDRQDTDVIERYTGSAWQAISSRSYRQAPGDYTLTASLASMGSFSLPPGNWQITGTGYFDFSTGTARSYAVDLYNNTAAVELVEHFTEPHVLAARIAVSITDIVTLTVQSTIQFRGFTSVVDGSQFFKQIRLIARNAGPLN